MRGKGSSDSGMNTTSISFRAVHSFLNTSILAAASSLMDDPVFWIGTATTQQNAAWKSPTGRRGNAHAAKQPEKREGSSLLGARKVLPLAGHLYAQTPGRWSDLCVASVGWVTLLLLPLSCPAQQSRSPSPPPSVWCSVKHEVRLPPYL